jgi:hypothetical protein
MESAFLGQSYSSRSPVLATQTAINIYPVVNETKGSDVGGFYGTPGRVAKFTGSGEVRGLWDAEGTRYAVIGNTVWSLDTSWNGTVVGTLPNSSSKVSMVDNGTQLAIAHQDGMHWATIGSTGLAAVANAPSGAILTTQDEYVIFTEGIGGEWGITALGDLSTINPLDIATAEGAPDNLASVSSLHEEVWLFGDETTEIWDDTGAAFFPFQRASGGFIEIGCCARLSVVKLSNSIMWLGRDTNGRAVVYRANGYLPVRVSTHAIEEAIQAYSTVSDCFAYGYQEEGHAFYVMSFPTGDQTWVFDLTTEWWHQRATQDTSGVLHMDRPNCYVNWSGMHVVGDASNGNIYQSSVLLTTDNGTPVYRERAWEHATDDHLKQRVDSMELVALMGDGDGSGGAPIVWLQVSQDAGQSWGYERQRTLGPIGARKARARWRRLGAGRDTVYRIATNMSNRVSWIAGIVNGEEYAI